MENLLEKRQNLQQRREIFGLRNFRKESVANRTLDSVL